jgi:hypothetical protein
MYPRSEMSVVLVGTAMRDQTIKRGFPALDGVAEVAIANYE